MRTRIMSWSWRSLVALGIVACSEATATSGAAGEENRVAAPVQRVEVEASRVKLEAPRAVRVGDEVVETSEVIEFRVRSPEPIPARALDPVLVVGERQITEYRYEAANVLVFVEPQPERLQAGGEVIFQWGRNAPPVLQRRTGVRFDPSELDRTTR